MLSFEKFQNAITGYDSTVFLNRDIDADRDVYRVYAEIIPGVDVICTIRSIGIRDDQDHNGQLQMKAYELFIKAIE